MNNLHAMVHKSTRCTLPTSVNHQDGCLQQAKQQNKTTQTNQTYTKHLIRTRLLIYTRKDKTKNLQYKTTYTQKNTGYTTRHKHIINLKYTNEHNNNIQRNPHQKNVKHIKNTKKPTHRNPQHITHKT